MKIFKLFLSVVLMLALSLSLVGCIVIPTYKRYDSIDAENVSSVDIYDLRDSETRFGGNIVETETPIYTLEKDQVDEFLSDLADIRFNNYIILVLAAIDPSFEFGEWVVRINHTDDSYMLISCGGYGESFDANGQIISSNHYGCDDEEWEAFVTKFLPEELVDVQTTQIGNSE